MKRNIRWAALGLCGLLAACFSDTGPLENGAGTRTVHMGSSSFSPSSVVVSRGGSVTWVNDNPIAHDITPNNPNQGGAWTARKIAANTGTSFTFEFTQPGVFDYHCTLHSGMTGRITVN
jgi:plastocyanin